MKIRLVIVIALLGWQLVNAQDLKLPEEETVFETKDITVQPDFPGGLDVFYTYFDKKFNKPKVPDLLGKVFIGFTVEKDGTLSDIHTIEDIGFGTGLEAERVLQSSPKWIPGRKNGKVVRVKYILPIPIQTN